MTTTLCPSLFVAAALLLSATSVHAMCTNPPVMVADQAQLTESLPTPPGHYPNRCACLAPLLAEAPRGLT